MFKKNKPSVDRLANWDWDEDGGIEKYFTYAKAVIEDSRPMFSLGNVQPHGVQLGIHVLERADLDLADADTSRRERNAYRGRSKVVSDNISV